MNAIPQTEILSKQWHHPPAGFQRGAGSAQVPAEVWLGTRPGLCCSVLGGGLARPSTAIPRKLPRDPKAFPPRAVLTKLSVKALPKGGGNTTSSPESHQPLFLTQEPASPGKAAGLPAALQQCPAGAWHNSTGGALIDTLQGALELGKP